MTADRSRTSEAPRRSARRRGARRPADGENPEPRARGRRKRRAAQPVEKEDTDEDDGQSKAGVEDELAELLEPVRRRSEAPTLRPTIVRVVTAAVIEAMTMADMSRTANEDRMTSRAKSIPAIGALNAAPIPAPAPAATSDLT